MASGSLQSYKLPVFPTYLLLLWPLPWLAPQSRNLEESAVDFSLSWLTSPLLVSFQFLSVLPSLSCILSPPSSLLLISQVYLTTKLVSHGKNCGSPGGKINDMTPGRGQDIFYGAVVATKQHLPDPANSSEIGGTKPGLWCGLSEICDNVALSLQLRKEESFL